MPRGLPPELFWLFWDVEPEKVDLPKHTDFVLERLMQRGDRAAMSWVQQSFSRDVLREFVERRGDRLSPRDRAYWALISGASVGDIPPGGGQPPWARP